MKLLAALGLDWKILIAQLVNFAIFFFVLFKFGYKPIIEFLNERKEKIAAGVKDAEKAKDKLAESEEKEREIILAAKKEAAAIVEDARDRADKKRKDIMENAREEIGKIIEAEKLKIQAEKSETLKAIRKEVSGLIALSLEKVLSEKIDAEKDKELIEKSLKDIK